jgi:hypothetical protein
VTIQKDTHDRGERPIVADVLTAAGSGRLDWFAVADAVGARLVRRLADWCTVHVRAPVLAALRAGHDDGSVTFADRKIMSAIMKFPRSERYTTIKA